MATLPLRQIEGKYEIVAKIKEGGMGAIYKVRHLLLEEIRVIKVIRPQVADNLDLQRRFAREARAAIRLKHPNIAQLYDFAVESDGVAYMVMEFIDGVTLQEMLAKHGPAQLDLTLEIARQSLEALRYLHLQGYVHRDVAPDNLMLTRDFAGQPLVKLIDLGIVKHLAGGAEGLTATGMFLGKVRYSSPEQFSGEKGGLDQRSDLYSFGVMLYELLTGVCPIAGENLSQLVSAHLFQPPKSFEQTDPAGRVPEDVRAAVLQSLQKAPDQRIGSAQEFQALLARPTTQDLSQDLEATLATTINLPALAEQPQAGTTQDRIDAQFGLERTPGPAPGLRATDGLRADDKREQLAKLLSEAKQFAQERQWEESRRRLYQALAIDHDHQEVRALLTSVESSLAKAVEEEKRRRALARVVERIDGCLNDEQLELATRELEQAHAEYGKELELSRLDGRVAELGRILAERARQSAIADAVAAIAADLEAERPEPAASALGAAQARFGEDARFAELASRLAESRRVLEERRREEEAAARRKRARALLAAAEEAASQQAFADAIARAEEAVVLDPGGPAQQALQKYRADEARRAEEIRRRRALDQAILKIEKLLSGEQADAAAQELESAQASFGESERLGRLSNALASLRSKLEERERERAQQQAIAAAVSSIESHLARENADDAQRTLEEATARLGADPRFASSAKSIARLHLDLAERQRKREEEARRRREEELRGREEERLRREAQARREEEERRQREAVQARRRRAQELLREAAEQAARGELPRALETSLAAVDFDPEPARAAAERYEQALEVAARARRLEQLLAAARHEIAAGALESARTRLEAGRRDHGADLEWQQLVDATEAEIELLAAERGRRETMAAEAAAVERLITKGRLKQAEKRLGKARADLGDGDTLVELERRLESLHLEAQRRAQPPAEVQRAGPATTQQARAARPLYWAAAAVAALVMGVGAWSLWQWRSGSAPTQSVAEVNEGGTGVATEIGAAQKERSSPAARSSSPAGLSPGLAAPPPAVQEEKAGRNPEPLGETARKAAPPATAPERPSGRSAEGTEAVPPPKATGGAVEPPPSPAQGAVGSQPAKPSVQSAPSPGAKADPAAKTAASPDTRSSSAGRSGSPPAAQRSSPAAEVIQLPVEQLPVPRSQPTALDPGRSTLAPEPAKAEEPRSGTRAPVPIPVATATDVERPVQGVTPPAGPLDATSEKRRVMEVLALYAGAIEAFDAEGLRRVWPGISSDALATFQSTFDEARSIDVSITECQIEVETYRAAATCTVRQTYRPKRGTRQNLNTSETFRLTSDNQRWVIASRTSN